MQIKIGEKIYKHKKNAIEHYRSILNSYKFGESLSEEHYDDLIDLLEYDLAHNSSNIDFEENLSNEGLQMSLFDNEEGIDNDSSSEEIYIEDIKVVQVQYNTKCFELHYSDKTSGVISYMMIFNNTRYTPEKLFATACRNAVFEDIFKVKKNYFAQNSVKGKVKCMESGILSEWSELVVDHRQPNTFSIILDRFKEINNFDLDSLEYILGNENKILFKNISIAEKFIKYHSEKSTFRIIRKEINSSRASMGRVSKSNKDLIVEDN